MSGDVIGYQLKINAASQLGHLLNNISDRIEKEYGFKAPRKYNSIYLNIDGNKQSTNTV